MLSGGAFVGFVGTVLYTNQRFDEIEHRHAQRIDQLMAQSAIEERESRVLQERLNDMKVELIKHGISLSDH